jgi:hypothetical protein
VIRSRSSGATRGGIRWAHVGWIDPEDIREVRAGEVALGSPAGLYVKATLDIDRNPVAKQVGIQPDARSTAVRRSPQARLHRPPWDTVEGLRRCQASGRRPVDVAVPSERQSTHPATAGRIVARVTARDGN